MPTLPQCAAGVAGVCLVAAITWLIISEFPVADPGKPTTKASPIVVLEAAVPAIGPFSLFNVNEENPFVPSHLRKIEILTRRQPVTPANGKPRPEPQVAEVPKPVLPKLGASLANGPRATGVLISREGPQALLTFPGETKGTTLKPGDSVKGWTLVDVIGGNVVRLKDDASGTVHDLVIADTPNSAKAPPAKAAKDKPADSGKASPDGKMPGDTKGAAVPGKLNDGKPSQDGKPQPAKEKPSLKEQLLKK